MRGKDGRGSDRPVRAAVQPSLAVLRCAEDAVPGDSSVSEPPHAPVRYGQIVACVIDDGESVEQLAGSTQSTRAKERLDGRNAWQLAGQHIVLLQPQRG